MRRSDAQSHPASRAAAWIPPPCARSSRFLERGRVPERRDGRPAARRRDSTRRARSSPGSWTPAASARTSSAGSSCTTGCATPTRGSLGAPVEDVALTTSTTDGFGRVLTGLGLGPGDEILTSDQEHPGLLGPLLPARRRGVTVRAVPFAHVAEAVRRRRRWSRSRT